MSSDFLRSISLFLKQSDFVPAILWRWILGPALAVVLVFVLPSIQAQEASSLADTSLEDLLNVKVSTASKHLQFAKDAPAFAAVITSDEIHRYAYRTLADALQSVGGFYITYDRNYSYVGVRGFGRPGDYNTRILVLVDGHRMNDAVYDSALVGTEFPLDIELVERIEVIRGPGASLYGTNAFFAVVNVITRKAAPGVQVESSMQAMSFGGLQGRVTLNSRMRGTDVLASASAFHSSGQDYLFPESGRAETSTIRHADYESSYSMFVHAGRGHWAFQGLYGSRDKGIPTGAFDTALLSGSHTIDNRGYGEARYETVKNDWDVLARGAYDAYYYAATYIRQDDAISPAVVNRDYTRADTVSTEVSLSRLMGPQHHLTTGGEVRLNLRQEQGNYDVDPRLLWLADRRRSWVVAGFVQDEYRLSKSLLVNMGIRLDQYSTAGTNVNPRLGLIWQPQARTTAKLLYGSAFRTPNVFEMYYTSPAGAAEPALNLKPERIRTMELILERGFAKNARLVASVFRNDISKLIGETTDQQNNIVYRNMEQVRATGLDLQVEGKLDNGISARAAYTYVDTDNAATDAALSNSPHTLLKAGISAPFVHDVFNAAVNGVYVSRRNTLQDSSIPGYTRIDLTLLVRKSGQPWSAALTVGNLFNAKYWDPGSVEHPQSALQQDGRSVRLNLRYTFGAQR